jgi:hypothetical protein
MSEPIPNQLSSMAPATGPTAPPASSRGGFARSFVSSLIGRIIIIAVIAVGAFLVRNYTSGNASDLKVGDCFDRPPAETQDVTAVQHHPCTESHTGEVVFVGDYPSPADAPYPSVESFQAYVGTNEQDVWILEGACPTAFAEYTGSAFEDAQSLNMGWFYPGAEGWKTGDHEIACYLFRLDEAPMTQSFRNAKP